MITLSNKPVPIVRDHWKLSIDANRIVIIEGRHRTSESFWKPFHLSEAALEPFVHSMGNAMQIIDGFCHDTKRPMPPLFPNFEMVAICQGASYWLEMAETTNGSGKRSTSVVVYRMEEPVLPVLYLVDDDLAQFYGDLLEIKQQLYTATNCVNGCSTNHPIDLASSVIRGTT